MVRITKEIRFAFLPVLGIVLAITFFIFQSILDFRSIAPRDVVWNIVFAILISLAATLLLVGLTVFTRRLFTVRWQRFKVSLTLNTVDRAVRNYLDPVLSTGIGEKEGNLVVRLSTGTAQGTYDGDHLVVLNSTTRDEWGVLEVIEVDDSTCLCRVSDRENPEFWQALENQIRTSPSLPEGVWVVRNIPQGFLDFFRRLIGTWGR